MDCIRLVAVRTPINEMRKKIGGQPYLVSGLHRPEAAIRLGLEDIATITYSSEDESSIRLVEIDKNLMQLNLSVAQEAEAMKQRAEMVTSMETTK
jgi:hypothetical protein